MKLKSTIQGLHVLSVICLISMSCMSDSTSEFTTAKKLIIPNEPYPSTIPSMLVQSNTGLQETLKVSHEWPFKDESIPAYEYAEPPIKWPPAVDVSNELVIVWDTLIQPMSVEIWVYDKRDSEGIPNGDPIGYFQCGHVESNFLPCQFAEGDIGISITTQRIAHSDKTTLMIVQAEWMTSPDTNFHTARASWASILQPG